MSYVFVADDFTGASDTLATLARGGLRVRLFRDVPLASDLTGLDAWGIATHARSLERAAIVELGQRIGNGLATHTPQIMHVKVCSTFDSGPELGNIAAFAQALAENSGIPDMAVIAGQPSLGRYAVFGTLFARGADGCTHRIDRHPVMSKHPVTPMHEADLILHLAQLGLHGLHHVGRGQTGQVFPRFYDALDQADVAAAGRDLQASGRRVVVIGSSSVAEAWLATQPKRPPLPPVVANSSGPVFAFAGSRSSVTTAQVEAAQDFARLPIIPATMMAGSDATREAFDWVKDRLAMKQDVIVYLTAEASGTIAPAALARKSAEFVRQVASECRPASLIVAGGDTSSAIINALELPWLDYAGEICAGVPILGSQVFGAALPLALKGGQMGGVDFFQQARHSLRGIPSAQSSAST